MHAFIRTRGGGIKQRPGVGGKKDEIMENKVKKTAFNVSTTVRKKYVNRKSVKRRGKAFRRIKEK